MVPVAELARRIGVDPFPKLDAEARTEAPAFSNSEN